MEIQNAQWFDAEKAVIVAMIDGKLVSVPTDPKNRHYVEIINQGIEIAEPEEAS